MIRPEDKPRLAAKARLREDGKTGETFLLYPERGLRLNPSAADILKLCDAEKSVAEIVADLSQRSGADRARVAAEVSDFLQALADRGLLEGIGDA